MSKCYTTTIENDAGKTNRVTGKPDTYFMLKKADMLQACRDLKEVELKVWLCLISNADGYTTEHMRKQIEDELGDSRRFGNSNITNAIKGLKEKGYIQESEGIEVVRTYGGSRPDNYTPQPKPGRRNHRPDYQPVKLTDSNCEINSTNLLNQQIQSVKLTDSTCEINSTNNTIIQDNTINNTDNNTDRYYNTSYAEDDNEGVMSDVPF